uniref:Uncharacterized protein n=1 Tax=Chromera velia CCMP2878 TaxID=1169474 RepID=A0A0G4HMH3_9ALVE|eukprot:Cvel_29158.t1-p1 / transcript=Cvel_29158.t1 / gene=Cvel_29158 / organism=Chromera_velia_CCMP2878 / gene_product=Fibrillin-1, putative / transcript_product=Fibrillin-1, putative / location=Cvel_scaffold3942:1292-12728(+) / protein_length=803 / sequence_SO=supercontig / SO=protein_coding / is_pseudo=false
MWAVLLALAIFGRLSLHATPTSAAQRQTTATQEPRVRTRSEASRVVATMGILVTVSLAATPTSAAQRQTTATQERRVRTRSEALRAAATLGILVTVFLATVRQSLGCSNAEGFGTAVASPPYTTTPMSAARRQTIATREHPAQTQWEASPAAATTGILVTVSLAAVDINECATTSDNCHTGALCSNTMGSFTCSCSDGFSGDGVSCSDIDECTTTADNCHIGASCSNTAGSFTCSCNDGYSGDGVSCSDVDECALSVDDCHVNANCSNTPTSFACDCNDGYSGDGLSCSDVNECTLNIDNCLADLGAICTNSFGSFECLCSPGFFSGGSTYCTDLDECAVSSHDCHADASCFNEVGSFTCACNSGFGGDGVQCFSTQTIACGTRISVSSLSALTEPGDFCNFLPLEPASLQRFTQPSVFLEGNQQRPNRTFHLSTCTNDTDFNSALSVTNYADDVCVGTATDVGSSGCPLRPDAAVFSFDPSSPTEIFDCRVTGEGSESGTYGLEIRSECACPANWTLEEDKCRQSVMLDECSTGVHLCSRRSDSLEPSGVFFTSNCTDSAGSYSCTCKWGYTDRTGVGTICEDQVCSNQPQTPANGALEFANPMRNAVTDSRVTVSCDPGFALDTSGGPQTISCEGTSPSTAAWPSHSFACNPVECTGDVPTQPEGGTMSGTPVNGLFWQATDTVSFSCNDGHLQVGVLELTCEGVEGANPASAVWPSHVADCARDAPEVPELGWMLPDSPPNGINWVNGDSVTFGCLGDTVLEGASSKQCIPSSASSAIWVPYSSGPPTCTGGWLAGWLGW